MTCVLGARPRGASAGRFRGTRPRALPAVLLPLLPPLTPTPFLVHFVPSPSPVHIWTGRVLAQFISGKIIKQHESNAHEDDKGKLFPSSFLEGQ